MVMEEIYILTKHGRFSAEYIESAPVYKRRFYLNLLKEEFLRQKEEQEKAESRSKSASFKRSRK